MHDDLICHSQSFNTVILYDIENLTKGNSNPQFNFSLEDIIQKIKRYNLVDKIAGQDGVDFSTVHKVFKDQISGFDYNKQGYKTFKAFLNSIIQGTIFKIIFHDKYKTTLMLKIK